jgi:hypothetical protein
LQKETPDAALFLIMFTDNDMKSVQQIPKYNKASKCHKSLAFGHKNVDFFSQNRYNYGVQL